MAAPLSRVAAVEKRVLRCLCCEGSLRLFFIKKILALTLFVGASFALGCLEPQDSGEDALPGTGRPGSLAQAVPSHLPVDPRPRPPGTNHRPPPRYAPQLPPLPPRVASYFVAAT